MPKPVVIDISHHNTIPHSLQPAKDAGIVGVIHKLTEGSSYVDETVQARYRLARDAGLLWGVYHFARPGDGEAQAEFFVDKSQELGVADDNTLYVLDHEDEGFGIDDALDFLRRVEELTGHAPVIYSGHVLKEQVDGEPNDELANYKLWLAQYGPTPELPDGWNDWWLWQYTESGTCPGINAPVDLNAYNGSSDELADEWSGSGVAPEPEPDRVPVWLLAMRTINGLTETPGSDDNPKILAMRDYIARKFPAQAAYANLYQHDSTAWCGLCAAFCMAVADISGPFGETDTERWMWALSWSEDAGFKELDEPRLGCVVVMEREGGGHVTLFERSENNGDTYVCRGGNQSDQVCEARYQASDCWCFWPVAAVVPVPDNNLQVVTINVEVPANTKVVTHVEERDDE